MYNVCVLWLVFNDSLFTICALDCTAPLGKESATDDIALPTALGIVDSEPQDGLTASMFSDVMDFPGSYISRKLSSWLNRDCSLNLVM